MRQHSIKPLLTLVVVRYHKYSEETLHVCKFCEYTTVDGADSYLK